MMFDADLRQPVGVGLAGAEVAALDGVVKEAENAVAVVAVVLGGVDPALGGDRVSPARAVVKREAAHLVALLAERGGRGRPGQARADDQDGVLPPVGGAHQLHVEAAPVPLLFNRSRRDLAVEHLTLLQRIQPASTATGTEIKPANTTIATPRDIIRRTDELRALFKPSVWSMLQTPWSRCRHRAAIATM